MVVKDYYLKNYYTRTDVSNIIKEITRDDRICSRRRELIMRGEHNDSLLCFVCYLVIVFFE